VRIKDGSATGKDFSAIGVQIILAEVVIPMRVQGRLFPVTCAYGNFRLLQIRADGILSVYVAVDRRNSRS
jgi:hypothetical protein